jgi:DNA-binding Lrp family transcriptional regulator
VAEIKFDLHCQTDETPTISWPIAGEIRQMDDIDRRMLEMLREDARAPTAKLARELGLSRTTVQSRLERLERNGVITGYTVRLSDAHERGQIHAYILLTVTPKNAPGVVAAMRRLPAVRLLQSVSGPFDLIAEVVAPTVAEMDAVIDTLGALDGVERTTSSVVLSTKVNR